MAEKLAQLANGVPVIEDPGEKWLDRLAPVQDIDPGEALIFAAAAETGMMVLSGDKRALRALKDVDGITDVLDGRIMVIEAVLIALCDKLGQEEVRLRLQPIVELDTVVRVCFATTNHDPPAALWSYFDALRADVASLILWDPSKEAGE